jgi:hypothetical protein
MIKFLNPYIEKIIEKQEFKKSKKKKSTSIIREWRYLKV